MRVVGSHAPGGAYCVRGDFTKKVLEANGLKGAVATGCPSLLLNPDPHLGRKIKEAWGRLPDAPLAAVMLPSQYGPRMVAMLLSIVNRYPGSFVA
eukprot:gene44179-63094_t